MFEKIIVDGNNLFHREYSVAKSILEKENKILDDKKLISYIVDLFLKSLRKIEREHCNENTNFYFLFDNPHSKELLRKSMDEYYLKRKELDPEYKALREKKDDSFYQTIDVLRMLLHYRSSKYYDLQIQGLEADDSIYALLNHFRDINEYRNILIISNDLDWFRCLDDKNNILIQKDKELYNNKKFIEKYNYEPTKNKIIMYKTFRGDSSDNIPQGVKGIRENILLKILSDFEDIYSLLKHYKNLDYLSDNWKQQIEMNQSRLILNYQLVSFIDIDKSIVEQCLVQGERNEEKLIQLYKAVNLDVSKYENNIESKKQDFFKQGKIYER